MTVEAIKQAIEELSETERGKLADWFVLMEEEAWKAWDKQIEADFSPGGRGMPLLEGVKADIAAGKYRRVEELCDERKQSSK
jgi:hypothetical protein